MIVGIDPRQQSVPALAWAVDEDVRRRLSLRLVTAVPPLPGGQHTDAPWRRTTLRAQGDDALAEAVATVRALHAEVPLTTELLDGTPSAMLCQKAARAQMTVVGSRRFPSVPVGSRRFPSVPVGSLDRRSSSAWARWPFRSVPRRTARSLRSGSRSTRGERHPHLVVGVDGSESSRAAVEFAVKRQRCTALPCGPCGCGGGP
ncbi:universal stress protein [Streptomyces sp. NPDC059991]|uniref:universal stress protein n=1 Tax=Streptomyces sp. NPDC059991 TaxID=3347028 RepID=UPI0036B9E867